MLSARTRTRPLRAALMAYLACATLASAGRARQAAQHGPHDGHGHTAPARPNAAHAAHAPATGEHHDDAAAHGGHDESAPPPPVNWTHGLLGEKAGVEPSLLWRAPGAPPPFLASVLNFALLIGVLIRYGKKPLSEALTKRKTGMLRDIEDSQRMRTDAEKRLHEYESRLSRMSEELERVRSEYREQGERDKERIVREATERRQRMLDDAQLLLAQEAKDLRQVVLAELVEDATRKAAELLSKQMTLGDHDRFAEAALANVRARGAARTSGSFGPPRGSLS